jgi:hypothetical protein
MRNETNYFLVDISARDIGNEVIVTAEWVSKYPLSYHHEGHDCLAKLDSQDGFY